MRTTVTAARGARLLLLFCTLLGLAAMHTIGHDSHPAGHSAEPSAHAVAGPGPHPDGADAAMPPQHDTALAYVVVATFQAVAGCAGDCVPDRLLPFGGAGGELPGWGVCLAVLGAFVVTLLAAALLSAVARAVGPPGRGTAGTFPSPRAPPHRPVGLRLATVSVLRR
ncbi:hypothetical protein [Micromonospora peucetia]|uniref:Uncharacterized protein n=1 Tax=Micromonospora peucetia TaxID=47871 RepID=A0ABZ1EJH3_9ACTN|nr:hypothetical protein [Micromonospora peucetia]WSA34385.1 hypothetical protein OIE14_10245 [Micromonospora peucetia]